MDLVPPLLALAAAAIFGTVVHLQQIGLDDTDGLTGSLISVGTVAVGFWLFSPLYMEWDEWMTGAALLFAVCGLVFPALAQRLQVAAIHRVGPSLSASVGAFAPVFAVVPAVMILGEPFGLVPAAGLALMIGALVASTGVRVSGGWHVAALLLPLGAAAARGFTQPIARAGLIEVPDPAFATLVMATVSTIVLAAMTLASPRRRSLLRYRPGMVWFAASGVANGVGILALNAAIGYGGVVIAAPLATTTPLWALLYGAVIFRREKLHVHHGIVAVLVAIGAVLVVSGGGEA